MTFLNNEEIRENIDRKREIISWNNARMKKTLALVLIYRKRIHREEDEIRKLEEQYSE